MFRKHLLGAFVALMLAHCIGPGSDAYLVQVGNGHQHHKSIFQAGLKDPDWTYGWSDDGSPSTTRRFFHLDAKDGSVRLRRALTDCTIWKLSIEARRSSGQAQQALIPLTVRNKSCATHNLPARRWTELLVVAPPPSADPTDSGRQFNEVCLRQSELVLPSLADYLPESIRLHCQVDQWSVKIAGDQLAVAVEPSGTDLVSTARQCRPGRAVKTRVNFRSSCSRGSEEAFDVVVQLDRPSSCSTPGRHGRGRQRRASQGATDLAPFSFEQPLYLTSVPEERDRGTFVFFFKLTTQQNFWHSSSSGPAIYSGGNEHLALAVSITHFCV